MSDRTLGTTVCDFQTWSAFRSAGPHLHGPDRSLKPQRLDSVSFLCGFLSYLPWVLPRQQKRQQKQTQTETHIHTHQPIYLCAWRCSTALLCLPDLHSVVHSFPEEVQQPGFELVNACWEGSVPGLQIHVKSWPKASKKSPGRP